MKYFLFSLVHCWIFIFKLSHCPIVKLPNCQIAELKDIIEQETYNKYACTNHTNESKD